ncbi:MAG: cyclic nucleotide-binding domain-containing protein [Candidatus Eremiobacteraeota bacterium]|nr:cyclic nucleotide-binding domain-containing protein [Candidatus Eremiobacteraeota bacterium]
MQHLSIEEVVPGCKVVTFGERVVVFGVPADVVKYFALQKKQFGHIIVLPDRLYERGMTQSVEFPLYKYIFSQGPKERGEKFTIVGMARQVGQISAILQQTVLGPTDEQALTWSTCGEADFVRKVRSYFRQDFTRLGEIVSFVPFGPDGSVEIEGLRIKRTGADRFCVSSGSETLEVDIAHTHVISPPTLYQAPVELIKPMKLGAVVLGTSTGFDPRGDTSNVIIYAKHLGISIDGSPWMGERLNLYGINPGSIGLFVVTHLHDDHSNIFNMMINGYRSSIATTNLIYRSFLVKASSILSIPMEDVEKLVHFIELRPGEKNSWYSNTISCFYTIHPIPTIGVIINGKILISGDTLWGRPLDGLVEKGIIEPSYRDFLMNLPFREGLELILFDGGGGPIHPEPEELAELPDEVRRRMYLTHVAELPPALCSRVNLGMAGQIFSLEATREQLDFEDVLALSESTLMRGAPHDWLRVFCSEGKVIERKAHEVIIDESTGDECFYFLLQGTLKVIRAGEFVARIYSGDYFGEMIFLGSHKRTATIISESCVKILAIPQEVFRCFIQDENVKRSLLRIMQVRPNFFHTTVFNDTPDNFLQEIIIHSRQRFFDKGEVIIREGDIGDHLYLILRGSCTVTKKGHDREILVGTLEKDDIFGEMALLSESKIRSATVTAREPTEVVIISREYFSRIITEVPSVFYNLTIIADERRRKHFVTLSERE